MSKPSRNKNLQAAQTELENLGKQGWFAHDLQRGGGAESENNRMLFAIHGFDEEETTPVDNEYEFDKQGNRI